VSASPSSGVGLAGAALAAAWLAAPVAGPAEGGPAEGLRVAFLGDSGAGTPEQKAVARQMRRFRRELRHVFLLGDNVYFTGQAKRFRAAFHDVYAPFLSPGPSGEPPALFHSALGNHDVRPCAIAPGEDGQLASNRDAYSWREEGCDVEEQLSDPAFGYPEGRRYYSVDLLDPNGRLLAEVYVLDSDTLPSEKRPEQHDPAQLEWLREELRASHALEASTGVLPWRIVTLHRPLRTPTAKGYIFGQGGHGEEDILIQSLGSALVGPEAMGPDPKLQAEMRPMLEKGRVDVVFAGHNHFYARLLPDDFGVRHFVSGGGGVAVYEPVKSSAPVASGGGFHHFVTAVLTPRRFEYCVVDALGRTRDHGWWGHESGTEPDRPLEDERRRRVCGR
jgi:hypothetical protein